jgi:hypothetical protein
MMRKEPSSSFVKIVISTLGAGISIASRRKMRNNEDDSADKRFIELVDQIHDKLCRINIYFMKEKHDHPMYKKHWGYV